MLIPVLALLKVFNFSLEKAGVTLKNWKKSLLEGVVISAILLLTFYLFYQPIDYFFSHYFTLNIEKKVSFDLTLGIVYLFHSYIQEFIARGVNQSALQRFYNDARGIKSVLVTSMIFGIFHLHISFAAAIVAAIFSLLFGFIYIRSYNLIGVSLVHCTIGNIGVVLGLFRN